MLAVNRETCCVWCRNMLEHPLQELSSWTSLPTTLSSTGLAACTMPKSLRSAFCIFPSKFHHAAVTNYICLPVKERLRYLQRQCACCGATRLSLIVNKAVRVLSTVDASIPGNQKSEQFWLSSGALPCICCYSFKPCVCCYSFQQRSTLCLENILLSLFCSFGIIL